MGMIPVALAIAGFVLLWVIVNYNSLSARRKNIVSLQTGREQLMNSYIILTKELSALLFIYGIDTPQYLVSLANDPGQKLDSAMFNKSFEQINLQIRNQNSVDLQENSDYTDLMRQMKLMAGQLLKNQQLLLAEINGYNQQAMQMPYRIVAYLFGFKRINSPVV